MPYDPSRDPHAYLTPSPSSPAGQAVLITPSDGADLATYAKALRIWVPGGSGTVRVTPVNAADGFSVDLTFPNGLSIEPLSVRKIFSTGTTAGLIIHAYVQ